MPEGQWTILQFKHTAFTTLQSTNLSISLICQGQGPHPEKMFTTKQESQQYKHTDIYSSKCLDNNFTNPQQCHQESHSSTLEKHPDLSYHRHPSTYFDWNQHAVPHHSIFIYLHAMNPMKLLSTFH